MNIELSLAYSKQDEIRKLFQEYTGMLVGLNPEFGIYLTLQNYEGELEHLDEKYGLPDGRLYLAEVEGQCAGCIALRKLDEKHCEMKRLYVRPEFRGHRLGELLARRIIDDAKEIGYHAMLLDTLSCLHSAVTLYRTLGFQDTECYNNSPVDETLFLKLDLI